MDEKSIKKQRISHLKNVKRLAKKFLDANVTIQQTRKSSWERDVNKNNIARLKTIINQTNKDLHDRLVNEYVLKELSQYEYLVTQNHFLAHPEINQHLRKLHNENEIFEVLRYSPNYSIVYDLYWIDDGTVGEQMDLAYGRSTPDIYEKYCPQKVDEIRSKVLPDLSKRPEFDTSSKILKNVINQFQSNIYLSSNILLITVAESMVRELCRYVYKCQNPSLSLEDVDNYINTKQSMETLIINGEWKNDISMDIREAYIQSKYIEDDSLKSAVELIDRHQMVEQKIREQYKHCLDIGKKYGIEELVKEELDKSEKEGNKLIEKLKSYQEELNVYVDRTKELQAELLSPETTISTSIKVKLQFLVRRFKEDRNSIIHGNYNDFDKGWKCYIYLAAIIKVWLIIKQYDGVYEKTA